MDRKQNLHDFLKKCKKFEKNITGSCVGGCGYSRSFQNTDWVPIVTAASAALWFSKFPTKVSLRAEERVLWPSLAKGVQFP